MLYSYILVILIIQAKCEWVEISQNYKKPIKPTHNHPLLATVSETIRPAHLHTNVETGDSIKTTYDRPIIDAAGRVSGDDRVNKRNRIYINHTLVDNNWDVDSVQKIPNNVNVKLKSDTKVNGNNVVRKPTMTDEIVEQETKSKGEIIIIRRPKPGSTKTGAANTDKPSLHRTTVAGHVVRVRPTNNKGATNKPKPIDEYSGPIEVFNLSDLEYTTAEDSLATNLDKGIENTVKLKQSASSTRNKQESSKSGIYNDRRNSNPNQESTTKQTSIFKSVTNMRRVDIIRSTKPTLIEDFDEYDYRTNRPSSSQKPEPTTESTNKRRDDTTIYKFPNLGQVKRVLLENNSTKTSHKPKPKNEYATTESSEDNFTRRNYDVDSKIRVDNATIRIITTEKSFPVRKKPGKLAAENRLKLHQPATVPNPEEVMLEELIVGEENHFDVKVHKVANIGTIKRVSNPKTATRTVDKNKLDRLYSTKQYSEPTPEIEIDEEATVTDDSLNINYNNINKNHYFTSSTDETPIPTTLKIKQKSSTATRRPEINPQIEKYDSNPYKPVRIREHIPEFVTKDEYGKIQYESTSKINPETTKTRGASNGQANEKRQETQNNLAGETKPNTKSNKNDDDHEYSEDTLSNDKKNSAMESLIKFLKTVTEIIKKNTRRGVSGKLRYLEDLKDTIMANIEERLEAEFPDDGPGSPGTRRARSAEPRGHVEFPSSEGALMTISFLTFAVFLIKLVLQVIQAYKNKTMMMMPTVVAAVGRAYSERVNRV